MQEVSDLRIQGCSCDLKPSVTEARGAALRSSIPSRKNRSEPFHLQEWDLGYNGDFESQAIGTSKWCPAVESIRGFEVVTQNFLWENSLYTLL